MRNIYAIVYCGSGLLGDITTVTIINDGQIDDSIIDTLEFDAGECWTPKISHIANEIYAIVYEGPDWDGFIKTLPIYHGGGGSSSSLLKFAKILGV